MEVKVEVIAARRNPSTRCFRTSSEIFKTIK